jgi:hypothetical protein
VFFTRVSAFVDQHKAEDDFSLRILNSSAAVDPEIDLVVGYPDRSPREVQWVPVSQILFGRYSQREPTKYVLNASN